MTVKWCNSYIFHPERRLGVWVGIEALANEAWLYKHHFSGKSTAYCYIPCTELRAHSPAQGWMEGLRMDTGPWCSVNVEKIL